MVDQGPVQATPSYPQGPEITSNDKTMGLLAYIIPPIGSAIILLSESNKNRPFQRYHAMQALGLLVVYILAAIIVSIGGMILAAILHAIGSVVACCVNVVLPLAILAAAIYCAVQAYQGKVFEIPYLSAFMIERGWLKRV